MSYCKKHERPVSVMDCLVCTSCLPPCERINGDMCGFEVQEGGQQ